MASDGTIISRATSDGEDGFIKANEPLAGLQLSCGGTLPGKIAIPELRELVQRVRRYGIRLARAITACDGAETITAWIEVSPSSEPDATCEIIVRSWHGAPLRETSEGTLHQRKISVDREVAELNAHLDAAQRILAVTCESAELADLASQMEAAVGTAWTEILPLAKANHRQPMHWRLLDGAAVQVAQSKRDWRVTLIPHAHPGFEPAGFELLLLSDQPPAEAAAPPPEATGSATGLSPGVVGLEVAPVLRQPISRIIANAESIRMQLAGPLPDAYAGFAGDIVNAGKLLIELLEDLADLEVVESENFHTQPDQIDLGDVARQAAGILGMRAKEKNITLQLPPPGLELPAIAEFRRVLQILLNLIGNAIHYSPNDSRITIGLERHRERARLIVADEGPGLDPDEQAAIFRKFERLGRSGDGGSGLGLYIARRLAEAMDGSLFVESARGQGSRFILEVPADAGVLFERGA